MAERAKILFIIPSMERGGAERILSDIIVSLDRKLYEPILVIFAKKEKIPENILVYNLEKKNVFDFIKLIFRLRAILIKERPSLVVSFITYANYISLLAKQFIKNKIPVIVVEHSVVSKTISDRFYFLKKCLISHFYPQADRIITVSNGCKQELIKLFCIPEKLIMVISNGINCERIIQLAKEDVEHHWFKENVPIVVSIGRLTKAKNIPLLLKAFSLLKSKYNFRLAIIGEGEERTKLLAIVQNLGLSNEVALLGHQKNPYKYLSRSRLLVMSSSWESFSLVILEAMCLGIPVISTDCPFGPAEIIENEKTGILIPMDNPFELARAIFRILTDEVLYIKLAKTAKIHSASFNITNMLGNYQKAFMAILQ